MQERYTATARWLHWLTVALVLVQAVLGFWMARFEPAEEALKYRLYAWHENSGFTLLLVVLLRLGWRLRHRPSGLPAGLAPPLRWAARGTHAALYALLLGLPLLGVWASTAWGFPFHYLGRVEVASPFGKNEGLAPVLSWLHDHGAWLLLALVALHAAAACWHQWVRRDGTLRKML